MESFTRYLERLVNTPPCLDAVFNPRYLGVMLRVECNDTLGLCDRSKAPHPVWISCAPLTDCCTDTIITDDLCRTYSDDNSDDQGSVDSDAERQSNADSEALMDDRSGDGESFYVG